MFFRRRDTDGIDPWLHEKMALFTAGAVVALVGMLLDEGWVIGLAALLLLAGLALRFVPRGEDEPPSDQGS